MNLVTSLEEIFQNFETIDAYRSGAANTEFEAYRSLVKRGTCFFPYVRNGLVCFAPSRFLGYSANSLIAHAANNLRDGRETNEAINALVGAQPLAHSQVDQLYVQFCASLGIVPSATGSFGAPRRYWLTPVLIDAIEQLQVDATSGDPTIGPVTRETIVQARIGQGRFRQQLLARWKGCCLTGCTVATTLRASHIKPWWIATNDEKIDEFNGLILTANLDALFDAGYISFQDNGDLMVSAKLKVQDLALLAGAPLTRRLAIEPGHLPYLQYHRENEFEKFLKS